MDFDLLKQKAQQALGNVGGAISSGIHDVGSAITGGASTLEHSIGINTPQPTGSINIAKPAQPTSINVSTPQPTQPNLSVQPGQNPTTYHAPFTANVGGSAPTPTGSLNVKQYTAPPPSTPQPVNISSQPVAGKAPPTNTDSNLQKIGHFGANLAEGAIRPAATVETGVAALQHKLAPAAVKSFYPQISQVSPGFAGFAGGANIGKKATPQQIKNATNPLNVASSVAQLGLDVAAPGIARAVEPAVTGVVGAIVPGLATRLADQIGMGLGGSAPVLDTALRYGTPIAASTALGGPYNALNQISSGQKVTPQNIASSYAQGTGYGLLFGAGGEASAALGRGLVKVGGTLVSQFGEPALQAAEKASGLNRSNLINDNDAATLHDLVNNGNVHPNTQSALNSAGIDMTGSAQEVSDRINNYLDQRSNFITTHNQVAQGGYIGGRQAAGFGEANLNGKTFQGEEGLPRFEADDSQATVNIPTQAISKLGDILNHPTLFNDYPQLQDVNVAVITPKNKKLLGGYSNANNTIYVNQRVVQSPELLKTTLLHETQHAIQNVEGFAQGTTSKAAGGMGPYLSNPGEQEAAKVGARANLTATQRAGVPFQTPIRVPTTIQDVFPRRLAASEAGNTVDGYASSNEMLKDYADMLRGMEKTAKGGMLQPDGQGGYIRTSEHSQFYRQFFADNGHAPSKAAYLEQAEKELASGKGAYGASDTYSRLKAQEPIPQDHAQYFNTEKTQATIPLDKLKSSKTETENAPSGANAQKIMARAANGEVPKRDPIKVTPMADGTYKIVDGNATYTAAKQVGWKDLPVQIVHKDEPGSLLAAAKSFVSGSAKYDKDFQSTLAEIAKDTGNNYHAGPIKSADRVAEKAITDYGGDLKRVKDAVRGTLEVENPRDLQATINKIANRFKITNIKDGYANNMPGYKDVKVNVRLRNGNQAEILIATPEMLEAKNELGGHELYEQARTTVDASKLADLEAQMHKLYDAADAALDKRLASSSETSVPSTKALAGEKGAPVSTTEPETLPPSETSLTSTSSTSKNLTPGEVNGVAIRKTPSTSIIAQKAAPIDLRGRGSPHQPELPIPKPERPTAISETTPGQNIKLGPQQELVKEPYKGNVESLVGNNLGESYKGPNLNKEAFSTEDQARLSKQLDIGNKVSVEEYARKYSLTPLQAQEDYESMAKDIRAASDISPENLDRFGPPLTIAQKREIIADNPQQQTTHQVSLQGLQDGNTQGAIARASGISNERSDLYNETRYLSKNLSQHEKDLLYRYDNGESIDSLAREANDPAAFTRAANKGIDALDYSLAADRAGGGATLRQQSYLPHYYQATEKKMDNLGIPENQRIKIGKIYRGYRDESAKYKSYIDANQKAGLKPLYKDPFEAIENHGTGGTVKIRDQLLKNALAITTPDEVGPIDMRRGINGETFRPASNGELPFGVSERLNKALANFQKVWQPKSAIGRAVMKGVEVTGSLTKKSLFFLSFFHQAHISENVAFSSILGGMPRSFAEGLLNEVQSKGGLSRGSYIGMFDHYRQNGALEFARNDMGLVLSDHSALDRFINSYALSLAKAAKDGGINPGSQEAIDLGRIYNRLLGRDNPAVDAHNPTIDKLISYFTLAPHYLRSQLKLVANALLPQKLGGAGYDKPVSLMSPGGAARSAVLGTRLFGALFTVTASAIIAQKFPSWKDVINEAGANSNNVNPNVNLKSRNAKGETQVMNIPTDPLGLAIGFVTDPMHFAQSRLSPLGNFAMGAITNKNWNGLQLTTAGEPNALPIRIAKAAENAFTPIGLQNFTNLQRNVSNPNIVQGIAQEFGGRLKTNPNDPQVVANNKYSNTSSQITSILSKGNFSQLDPSLKNVSWQQAQQFVNTYNSLHPVNTTDATGQKFPQQYNASSSEVKYNAYTMTDPTTGQRVLSPVFYADKKLENATPGYPSSPLYRLNGTGTDVDGSKAPQSLVALEYQHQQDPAAKTVILNANGGQNGWLAKYENNLGNYSQNYQANLTDYFKSLGWQPKAINTYWQNHPSMPDPIAAVNFPQATTNLINQYYALSASGNSTATAQFFSQNSGVLGNAFDLEAQHANALRSASGELQMQGYPSESAHVSTILDSMPSGSDPASKKSRAVLIQNNPDVNQYLADVALYESLSKGAQFRYINPANPSATEGQNINTSGQAGQTFLKDTASLGAYDIGKNALGNYSFMQNGGFPAGTTAVGASSSSSSSKKPLIPLPPKRRAPHKQSFRRPRLKKERAKTIRIHKTTYAPIRLKHAGPLKPVKIGR